MHKSQRKYISYANVVATLALVFSMSGAAFAAHHYLITSTKQISPKVITSLKGKNGKTGPAGAQGPQGQQGVQGPAGSAVAFAYVIGSSTTPTLSNAKNVSSVSRAMSGGSPITGETCITTTVPFQNIAGITDAISGNGVTVSADTTIVPLAIAGGTCPPGTTVIALTGTEKAAVNANFWISFN